MVAVSQPASSHLVCTRRKLESPKPGYGVSVGAAESAVSGCAAVSLVFFAVVSVLFVLVCFPAPPCSQPMYDSSHRSLILSCNCCLFFLLHLAHSLSNCYSQRIFSCFSLLTSLLGSLGGELFLTLQTVIHHVCPCALDSFLFVTVLSRSNY